MMDMWHIDSNHIHRLDLLFFLESCDRYTERYMLCLTILVLDRD